MAADARGRLWQHLRGLLPSGAHVTRIENEIGSGFPDVHYTYRERTGTIELKVSDELPLRKRGLRKSQIDWMTEEIEAGGTVWILVQVGKWVYAISGLHAKDLNDLSESELIQRSYTLWEIRKADPDKVYNILMN